MIKDLTNERFNKWTVIKTYVDPTVEGRKKYNHWYCKCDCGNISIISGLDLESGRSKSCGCAKLVQSGKADTREYDIWLKMKQRCYNEANDNYKYYGGIGIYVCARWKDSFLNFLEDLGYAPSNKHMLGRIDKTKSHTCGKCSECLEKQQQMNCRWETKEEQARNNTRNISYTHNNKTLILKDWAKLLNINYQKLWKRLDAGWTFEEAVCTEKRKRPSSKSF